MGRQEMKVAVDTNVLVRAVVRDDPVQANVAATVLTDAELIAVALPCLCEFVWVLLRVYGFQQADAAARSGHYLPLRTWK
jgi:predicted nucleic-acid-binding protein